MLKKVTDNLYYYLENSNCYKISVKGKSVFCTCYNFRQHGDCPHIKLLGIKGLRRKVPKEDGMFNYLTNYSKSLLECLDEKYKSNI
jgi:hypothetical protein